MGIESVTFTQKNHDPLMSLRAQHFRIKIIWQMGANPETYSQSRHKSVQWPRRRTQCWQPTHLQKIRIKAKVGGYTCKLLVVHVSQCLCLTRMANSWQMRSFFKGVVLRFQFRQRSAY